MKFFTSRTSETSLLLPRGSQFSPSLLKLFSNHQLRTRKRLNPLSGRRWCQGISLVHMPGQHQGERCI